jgi:hypothetical protein
MMSVAGYLYTDSARAIMAGYRLHHIDDGYGPAGWYWYTPELNCDADGYREGAIEDTEAEAWRQCCIANNLR